jgi:NAD(P)-dependent dehydrogenase (short-subunit alcohol dehydrogenase family)
MADMWGTMGLEEEEEDPEVVAQREKHDLDRGFTGDELETCMKVLGKLSVDMEAYKAREYKDLRQKMVPFMEDLRGRFFDGKDSDDYSRKLHNRREKYARKNRLMAADKKYINSTKLREDRIDSLNKLCDGASGDVVPLVPDGAARDAPNGIAVDDKDREAAEVLNRARSCYACKKRFVELHDFYDQLCPACASLNYTKRLATSDMTGRYALVTGGRVKIGFEIVLKLLRCGATVIATSRFPVDTVRRFTELEDKDEWIGRLHVHGIDLRNIASLEGFMSFLLATLPRLDVIVNNACQTVRRPPAYYEHLIGAEAQPASTRQEGWNKPLLQYDHFMQQQQQHQQPTLTGSSTSGATGDDGCELESPASASLTAAMPLNISAATSAPMLSQLQMMEGDDVTVEEIRRPAVPPAAGGETTLSAAVPVLPKGKLDVNEQQLDLRLSNSWLLKLGEVSTVEMVEAFAINTISPFIINSRLRPLLMKNPELDKYVINVSAMEGKFYRFKTECHPHTNMAKAALNMMTRTSAEEMHKHNIFMNSVDTGWINDENPRQKAADIAARHNFQTPLDEIDAAARVLDPVVSGMNGEERKYGCFFKDYKESEW